MIEVDISWDLSMTIQQKSPTNDKFQTKIPGKVDPAVATAENIEALAVGLTRLTRNTYIATLLTAQKDIADIDDEVENNE